MTLGSSNTPIEGSEIDVPSIVESAVEHISLDGSGNLDVPNGDIDLAGNKLLGVEDIKIFSGKTDFSLNTAGTGSAFIGVYDSSTNQYHTLAREGGKLDIFDGPIDFSGGGSAIQDAGTNAISFDGLQNVSIPNGDLDVTGTITSTGQMEADSIVLNNDPGFVIQPGADVESRLQSTGGPDERGFNFQFIDDDNAVNRISWARESGVNHAFNVYDIDTGDHLFTVNDSGSVEISNGDLTDGANIIYDQSASQIPRARLDGNKITSAITTNTTTSNEEILYVDTSGGPVTITLASADALDGNEITIVDSGGSVETNAITIATEGAETIDGASTSLIETNYSAQAVASDGTNWFTTGAGGGGGGNLSDVTIDTDKDWQNFDISNVRKFSAEDGVINGKTLEAGNTMTIEDDESMVVSGSYTVEGDLTINGSGSLTVI